MLNGWKAKVRTTSAIRSAWNTTLTSSKKPPSCALVFSPGTGWPSALTGFVIRWVSKGGRAASGWAGGLRREAGCLSRGFAWVQKRAKHAIGRRSPLHMAVADRLPPKAQIAFKHERSRRNGRKQGRRSRCGSPVRPVLPAAASRGLSRAVANPTAAPGDRANAERLKAGDGIAAGAGDAGAPYAGDRMVLRAPPGSWRRAS